MPQLSIVTGFFDEGDNITVFRERIDAVLADVAGEHEIVLVDDHSSDHSTQLAREWAAEDPRVQYLRLSRNCGSHAAFSAGLNICRGECAILLAADLQDPPETIPDLLAKWRAGNDVVWAVRSGKERRSWSSKLFAGAFYWFMRRVLPDMPSKGADFLLMDRKVVAAFNQIPEKNTNFLAMILWMGFRQTQIEYVKEERLHGHSKWTFFRKIKLFIDSVISFSYAPIRLMAGLGILMALSGFVYALVVVIMRLTGNITVGSGFAAIMTVLLVGQGAILCMLGILGEYVWRAFDEARGRPSYIVEDHIRSDDESASGDVESTDRENSVENRE